MVLDTAGNPETIDHDEIHRSTSPGLTPEPATLAATTASDEDTLTAGWQDTDADTSLGAGETYAYKVIAVDRAEWVSEPSNEVQATPWPLLDHADHDVGNIVLTMTDQGILGFMKDTQTEGSGLVFPASGDNLLFIGGLWVGTSETYVANRDDNADPERESIVAENPDGHVVVDPGGASDQDIRAGFTDGAAAQPRDLHVRL